MQGWRKSMEDAHITGKFKIRIQKPVPQFDDFNDIYISL